MKKQVVVRTVPTDDRYLYHEYTMKYLEEKLEEGYVVVMCNHIGKDLEYILEKEIND